MYPLYDNFNSTQNVTTELVISCENFGLKIEQLKEIKDDELCFSDNTGEIKISLFDYFDGFNISFSSDTKIDKDKDMFIMNITSDETTQVLLESVRNDRQVLYIFNYGNKFLIFYEETEDSNLLEAWSIDGNVKQLSSWEDKDYHSLLGN